MNDNPSLMQPRLIKRMARTHFEAVVRRLGAQVKWDERHPKANATDYNDMHAALGTLYEGTYAEEEGELMQEPLPDYDTMTAEQLVHCQLQKLTQMEVIFADKLREDAPCWIDVKLLRALRNAIVVRPIDTDDPILRVTDQMHTHLLTRMQFLNDEPRTREVEIEMHAIQRLLNLYESKRWSVPKMLLPQNHRVSA